MLGRDRRGRRRRPEQERGLRPLFPPLGSGWESRALRVAMPSVMWRTFERLVGCFPSATDARAHGEALSYLLERERRAASLWLDWDQAKQTRLLRRGSPTVALRHPSGDA
jgi:hypothetical protein